MHHQARQAWQWCEQVVEDAEKEHQKKHLEDQRIIESDMLRAPVVHTDCANDRCNGKNSYVYVC